MSEDIKTLREAIVTLASAAVHAGGARLLSQKTLPKDLNRDHQRELLYALFLIHLLSRYRQLMGPLLTESNFSNKADFLYYQNLKKLKKAQLIEIREKLSQAVSPIDNSLHEGLKHLKFLTKGPKEELIAFLVNLKIQAHTGKRKAGVDSVFNLDVSVLHYLHKHLARLPFLSVLLNVLNQMAIQGAQRLAELDAEHSRHRIDSLKTIRAINNKEIDEEQKAIEKDDENKRYYQQVAKIDDAKQQTQLFMDNLRREVANGLDVDKTPAEILTEVIKPTLNDTKTVDQLIRVFKQLQQPASTEKAAKKSAPLTWVWDRGTNLASGALSAVIRQDRRQLITRDGKLYEKFLEACSTYQAPKNDSEAGAHFATNFSKHGEYNLLTRREKVNVAIAMRHSAIAKDALSVGFWRSLWPFGMPTPDQLIELLEKFHDSKEVAQAILEDKGFWGTGRNFWKSFDDKHLDQLLDLQARFPNSQIASAIKGNKRLKWQVEQRLQVFEAKLFLFKAKAGNDLLEEADLQRQLKNLLKQPRIVLVCDHDRLLGLTALADLTTEQLLANFKHLIPHLLNGKLQLDLPGVLSDVSPTLKELVLKENLDDSNRHIIFNKLHPETLEQIKILKANFLAQQAKEKLDKSLKEAGLENVANTLAKDLVATMSQSAEQQTPYGTPKKETVYAEGGPTKFSRPKTATGDQPQVKKKGEGDESLRETAPGAVIKVKSGK